MKIVNKIHHVAIICSNYEVSKRFYTQILGFEIKNEVYRKERESYKLDLTLNDNYVIELFSFPKPPKRTSRPEATGLRHIAFEVVDIHAATDHLKEKGIVYETIRTDEYTNKKFTFISDPDGLPIELYEK
jgi:glyoxylase I family protein